MSERGTSSGEWAVLSSKFPATLAKDKDPTTLEDGETPDSFGLGIDRPGTLYTESSPSAGTAWTGIATVSEPSYDPVAGHTWRYFFGRLWSFKTDSNVVYYGAQGSSTGYIRQGLGGIYCDTESANNIQMVPFGNNVAVFKSDFLYVIRNADNPSAGFIAEYIKQASGLPVAADVVAIDNTLVWANTHGVFSYDGQNIKELTLPIRNNLGTFVSTTITSLKADFEKRRVICRTGADAATGAIISLDDGGLYDYATSGFRFTTPTVVGKDGEPLIVDKIGIHYQYSTSDRATINMDVKINDTWKTESQFVIVPSSDNGYKELPLSNVYACRRFAVRITAMSANFYISKITAHVKSGGIQGYSNK